MRIMILNFAYGIVTDGSKLSYLFGIPRFFYSGRGRCIELAGLVKAKDPDVVGIVEIDGGSMRSGFVPNWQELKDLCGYSVFALSKYLPESFWNRLPIIGKHMNGLFSKSGDLSDNQAPSKLLL